MKIDWAEPVFNVIIDQIRCGNLKEPTKEEKECLEEMAFKQQWISRDNLPHETKCRMTAITVLNSIKIPQKEPNTPPPCANIDCVQVIVIAPTYSAMMEHKQMMEIYGSGFHLHCIDDSVSFDEFAKSFNGAHVVCTRPTRLAAFLLFLQKSKALEQFFQKLKYLILDAYDILGEDQFKEDMDRIMDEMSKKQISVIPIGSKLTFK